MTVFTDFDAATRSWAPRNLQRARQQAEVVAVVDLAAGHQEALQPMVANTAQAVLGYLSQHVAEVVEEVDHVVQVAQVVGGTLGWSICHRGSLEQQGRLK
jgi:hypothetical protein